MGVIFWKGEGKRVMNDERNETWAATKKCNGCIWFSELQSAVMNCSHCVDVTSAAEMRVWNTPVNTPFKLAYLMLESAIVARPRCDLTCRADCWGYSELSHQSGLSCSVMSDCGRCLGESQKKAPWKWLRHPTRVRDTADTTGGFKATSLFKDQLLPSTAFRL